MKEYKLLTAKTPEEAERLMNEWAKQGWEVKNVSFWETSFSYQLAVTLERETNG